MVRLVAFTNGFETGDESYKEYLSARSVYSNNRLFRHAAHYCDDMYDEWYILSALHLVRSPDSMIVPHDISIKTLSQEELSDWLTMVSTTLNDLGLLESNIVVFWHTTDTFSDMFEGVWPDNKQQFPLRNLTLQQKLEWYASKGY